MDPLREMVLSADLKQVSDYFCVAKEIRSRIDPALISPGNRIRIAILPSFTSQGFEEVLTVECARIGILPDIYVCPYGQHVQVVLDPDSGLYRQNPDLAILFIDAMTLLGEQYLRPSVMTDDARREWVGVTDRFLDSLVSRIKEQSGAKVLLHNLEVPCWTPLGILEDRQPFGMLEAVEELNRRLRDRYREDSRVFLLDYNGFAGRVGKRSNLDRKYYYLGDMRVNLHHIPALCNEYMAYVKPLATRSRKCLVVDLDNTLWGGIIGEDEMGGIRLGPTGEGRAFWEFQKALLGLYDRGVILAINSRNNPEDALEAIRGHPYMILREEHFAAIRINWEDKVSNLRSIAAEIDIGLDSLVFMDDDPVVCSMVEKELPEVLAVRVPPDPSLLLPMLMDINDFNTMQLTEEDWKKGRMYADQRQRKESQKSATDLGSFLRSLDTRITIADAGRLTVPRISQLTLKTNQFNMTTRRYREEDILSFLAGGSYLVVGLTVDDRFGESGLTGVAILEKSGKSWRIDTLLLSCRVLGRGIEDALLAVLMREAREAGARILVGEFIPTRKNAPARDFYRRMGFRLARKEREREFWEYDLDRALPVPDYIRVVRE